MWQSWSSMASRYVAIENTIFINTVCHGYLFGIPLYSVVFVSFFVRACLLLNSRAAINGLCSLSVFPEESSFVSR